ncbi:hypothetical protein FQN57_003368, partial [Myotisia sp. PD_48]
FCRKTTLTKHQHRSHQSDICSSSIQSSNPVVYSHESLSSVPQVPEKIPEPPSTPTERLQAHQSSYEQPILPGPYYHPHHQAALTIPTPAQRDIPPPPVQYIGVSVVSQPGARYDILTTAPVDQLSSFHAEPPRITAPEFETIQSLPYNKGLQQLKVEQNRLLSMYPEQINWDFLGLE